MSFSSEYSSSSESQSPSESSSMELSDSLLGMSTTSVKAQNKNKNRQHDATVADLSVAKNTVKAVTTRTASTHEDLGKKAKTEPLDPIKEKPRVVKTTKTSGDQQCSLKENSSVEPHVEKTGDIPSKETAGQFRHNEIISTQIVCTVETITHKIERNGIVESSLERNITIRSDGDPIEHDTAVAEAMLEATGMNLDMTVEKIEIQRQTQIKLLFNKN